MDCKSTEKKLIFFIENALPPEDAVLVATHLEQCPDCRSKMEFLKETLSRVNMEKTVEVNPFLFTRIQARLEQTEKHETRRILKPLAIAAALVMGVFFGILLGQLTMTPKATNSEQEVAYLFQDHQMESMESLLMEDDL
ncbi:MAG TPA: zf-HC2 domain-containing protein [Bacteroidales bacterium]|nr:zf-HC2 domain-containing protein [Bacteroidales bacterium]